MPREESGTGRAGPDWRLTACFADLVGCCTCLRRGNAELRGWEGLGYGTWPQGETSGDSPEQGSRSGRQSRREQEWRLREARQATR